MHDRRKTGDPIRHSSSLIIYLYLGKSDVIASNVWTMQSISRELTITEKRYEQEKEKERILYTTSSHAKHTQLALALAKPTCTLRIPLKVAAMPVGLGWEKGVPVFGLVCLSMSTKCV